MSATAPEWIVRFAAALGTDPPSDDEQQTLLEMAATAAHASDRLAAPISCWLTARSGKSPSEGLGAALRVAAELGERDDEAS